MIKLIHKKAKSVSRITYKGESLKIPSEGIPEALWDLAEKFPDEVITWCEEEFEDNLNIDAWPEIFHQDLILATYAVKTVYLSEKIGYIDQFPFVNVNREVQYPTWRMSTDVGGVKGKVLLKFRSGFGQIGDFGFLLNSIAKLGQQNGLFCYSAPHLIKQEIHDKIIGTKVKAKAGVGELFSFVQGFYKGVRLWLLFWCFLKYEHSFPVGALVTALFKRKYFKKDLDLSGIELRSKRSANPDNSVDVIIPTLGRKQYLLQVLEDLKEQSLLPKKVIIVEQNLDSTSQSDLPELKTHTWPFEIVHYFTHKTGACHARNLGLKEVDAGWVFFADDDIRFEADLLQKSLEELKRLGADCLNINCKREGEKTIFRKIKQWGSFGSGTSLVNAEFSKYLSFDEVYEYGFGEDKDYGMQLRYAGCDIIYHPHLVIQHLKAPRGGFREIDLPLWYKDKPKPSPTLMIYMKKYFSTEQMIGFKIELFLKYYFRQEIKNPFKYLKNMKESWSKSEEWANKMNQNILQ